MMTFLLQFFLNNHCIDQNQILKWYNSGNDYIGFVKAKRLATSFIESLSTKESHTINEQIAPTNPTSAYQGFRIDIKGEPMIST
jgi:hypothetical protein